MYLRGFGGDTSNCAIAAARQGAKTGVITKLGADPFGDAIADLWDSEGIDARFVDRDPVAPTGIYFVTHGPDGHTFSYRRAGSASSRVTPDWIPDDYLTGAKVLHVSGISQAISDTAADTVFAAIEKMRGAGRLVSYDTNLRLQLWPLDRARAIIHAAVARSQIALPGLDDAELLTGHSDPQAIVDFYLGLGCETIALTLGAQGTLVATQGDRQLIPGRKVDPVDATGAGDTFDGAFLSQIVLGKTPFEAAGYANAAAAVSTQGYGAVAPMPTAQEVSAFLGG